MSQISALQGVREEVAARLGEVETDNTDQYTNWFNLSLLDLENTFPDAPYLWASADRTLSSGTREYPSLLPGDFSKMNTLKYPAGDVKLTFVTPEQLDLIKPSATNAGTPTIYTIRGSQNNAQIEFFPVPGGAYTVHLDYQKQMGLVSAGSSVVSATVPLPFKYIELPILYGEAKGLRRQGRREEAAKVEVEYEAKKQKMINDLRLQTTEMTRIHNIREFQTGARRFDDPIVQVYWGNRPL